MYFREESLLELYPFEVINIYRGRGNLYAVTSEGKVCMTAYAGTEAKAAFLAKLLRAVYMDGLRTEQVLATKEGHYVVESDDGMRYLLRTGAEGQECDIKSAQEVQRAIEVLADLHASMSRYTQEFCELGVVERRKGIQDYAKHTREMRTIKNYVQGRKKKTEFEREYMKMYAETYAQALDVVSQLEQVTIGEEQIELCHGDYTQHNILRQGTEVLVAGFDNLGCDYRIGDLVRFSRKVLEKNHWDKELGMLMLDTYHERANLSGAERQQVYLRLAYPEKFWKIANHFYSSNKAWGVGRYMEKLEKVKADEENRRRFLESVKEYWLFKGFHV